MAIDTRNALGANAENCTSRCLLLDKFCDPSSEREELQRVFTRAFDKRTELSKSLAWHQFIQQCTGGTGTHVLYAQLQSRLIVNMAGGVMENAGLCLDRFGLPYVPGSAVKGCARRAALAALGEWCETDQKPGAAEADKDNLFAAACQDFDSPAAMLAAIARVFGWGEQDWGDKRDKDGRLISDFAWACDARWQSVRVKAFELLGSAPAPGAANDEGASADRRGACAPPKDFAGSVSFLPAHLTDLGQPVQVDGLPLDVPPLGKLELDVVTCHHGDYYAGRSPVATDTEEPVPVVFPAVAAGHVFTFVLAPLRGADAGFVTHARVWLKTGLETFGLGAKTNAGYGWFKDVTDFVTKALQGAAIKRALQLQRQQDEQRRKAEEVERLRKAQERKAATASMTPEAKADYELAQLTEDQFRGRLDQFAKRQKSEQEAMVRALRLPTDQAGSRRPFWDVVKSKAQKGGKPAQIEQAIRQLSKQMFPGKEGKMP